MAKGYHNMVPSFGEWGYILAYKVEPKQWFEQLPVKLRYLDKSVAEQMFVFPKDMTVSAVMPVNRLNNQSLVHFFEEEWSHYQDQ
jgi:spermidine synthase